MCVAELFFSIFNFDLKKDEKNLSELLIIKIVFYIFKAKKIIVNLKLLNLFIYLSLKKKKGKDKDKKSASANNPNNNKC